MPSFVNESFERFLRYGVLAYGFARFQCADRRQDHLVPLSCKARELCPSCGGRRMMSLTRQVTVGMFGRRRAVRRSMVIELHSAGSYRAAPPALLHRALRRWVWLSLGLPLGSCGVMSWEERDLAGDGTVCLVPGASAVSDIPVRLEADAPLTITVKAAACLSSSCSREARGSCKVELRGQEVIVSSQFRWEEKTRGGCTDDCNTLSASCVSSPLPAGDYIVRHGGKQQSITVPSMRAQSCLSSP